MDQRMLKNALVRLNELKPGVKYHLVHHEGPQHAPVFVFQVTINNEVFYGKSTTKKKARLAAAVSALRSLYPYVLDYQDIDNENLNVIIDNPNSRPGSAGVGKHPIMILEDIRPGTKFDLLETTADQFMTNFAVSVEVDGENFVGSGQNMRLAQSRAAQTALQILFNVEFVTVSDLQIPDELMGISYISDEELQRLKFNLPSDVEIKNPVMELCELYKGLQFHVTVIDPINLRVRCEIEVEGATFIGESTTKKGAKYEASKAARDWICEEGIYDFLKEEQYLNRVKQLNKRTAYIAKVRGDVKFF